MIIVFNGRQEYLGLRKWHWTYLLSKLKMKHWESSWTSSTELTLTYQKLMWKTQRKEEDLNTFSVLIICQMIVNQTQWITNASLWEIMMIMGWINKCSFLIKEQLIILNGLKDGKQIMYMNRSKINGATFNWINLCLTLAKAMVLMIVTITDVQWSFN